MLNIKNYESWFSEIESIVNKYDNSLFKELDKLESYIEIYNIKDTIGEDIIIDVQNYIKSNFKYILLYYATATDHISSYLNKGLLQLEYKRMIDYARSIFNQQEFPEITDDIFNKAIDDVITNNKNFKEHKENIICFQLMMSYY